MKTLWLLRTRVLSNFRQIHSRLKLDNTELDLYSDVIKALEDGADVSEPLLLEALTITETLLTESGLHPFIKEET